MMEVTGINVNKSKVKEIFDTMNYGDTFESNAPTKEWFSKCSNNIFASSNQLDQADFEEKCQVNDINTGEHLGFVFIPTFTLDNILSHLEKFKKSTDLIVLSEKLSKFADEIEKNTNLIINMEMSIRGFLPKDTKASLLILIETLRYSSLFVDTTKMSENVNGFFDEYASLIMFGYVFAAGLSSGSVVLLATALEITCVAKLLIDLAIKAGFPKDMFLMYSNKINTQFLGKFYMFSSDTVLPRPVSYEIEKGKTPMIIFNSADLDSACESVVQAAWGNQGIMPWSVGTLLIQEDIFDEFTNKLKRRMSKIRMNSARDKQSDVSYPVLIKNLKEQLKEYLLEASSQGLDIYKAESENIFSPILITGGRTYGNNVITRSKVELPILTALPFRSSNEAAALANNMKQGLGASVWTENIGLANEITQKLDVGTIWINSHGNISAKVTMSMFKNGYGCFGGTEGLLNDTERFIHVLDIEESNIDKKNADAWGKLSRYERAEKIKKAIISLKNNNLTNEHNPEEIFNFIKTSMKNVSVGTLTEGSFNIIPFTKPIGCLRLLGSTELIINMLIEGNVIVVPVNPTDVKEFKFWMALANLLPGVLSIMEKFEPQSAKLTDMYRMVKNVWYNVGDSI